MDLRSIIYQWAAFLKKEMGYAENTVLSYLNDLDQFEKFLQE